MNLEQCKVLSKAEYGSRFQHLDDDQSDHDYIFLVLEPMKDMVFTNNYKGACEKDENKYFNLSKFYKIVMNGSYDGLIMLAAQYSNYYQYKSYIDTLIYHFFNNKDVLNNYYDSIKKSLILSLCGQAYKMKLNDAKSILNIFALFSRACYFNDDQYKNVALNDVVKQSTYCKNKDMTQWLRLHKRINSFEQLSSQFKNEFNEDLDQTLDVMHEQMNQFYFSFKDEKSLHFKYSEQFKDELTNFSLNQYVIENN